MSIHERLPPQARKGLKKVGWTKGLELAKLARRDGQGFDCATWLHKARKLPKEDFRRALEKDLTGGEEEPSELIYFKVHKGRSPSSSRRSRRQRGCGSAKSLGYRLEMVADRSAITRPRTSGGHDSIPTREARTEPHRRSKLPGPLVVLRGPFFCG